MKIIYLEAVQNNGGARMSTLELAKRMQDLGHEVLIVDFWGLDVSFIDKVKEYELEYIIMEKREKPFVILGSKKIKTIINAVKYIPIQLKYRTVFKRIVEDFKPDIVSVNNVKCLSVLDSTATYKIDFFVRTWLVLNDIPLRSRYLYKRYHPRFLAVSQASRQAIYTGGIARLEDIKVLHSVIDSKVFSSYEPSYQPFSQNNPINLLHCGGFLHTKGQHIAIEIARELVKQSISFKLILIGVVYTGGSSKSYYKSILNLIDKYGLKEQVQIIVNEPNPMEYFKQSNLLLHPSSSEGLPRVALEALSFGTPVIANPVGGVTDVVINNYTGFITDFNCIQQYISYIKKYYYDPALYFKHSKQSISLIEQNYLDSNQNELIKEIYPL